MYYVVYGLLWLISLLPIRVLYFFADGIYQLVYHVFRYRKEVVLNNLAIAFPEKTEKERKQIARRFYRNLIDTFIETIKMITVSPRFIEKRFTGNWEALGAFQSTGRPVQIHLGHNFNWEWGNAAAIKKMQMPFLAVYMPISNKIFDRLFRKLRGRAGTRLLRATHMSADFLPYRNTQYILALVADQNPGDPARAWWFQFFTKPAPFVKGPAKNAVANNTEVLFAFIQKRKRGYYEVVFTPAGNSGTGWSEKELTQKFVRYLEEVIRKNPDMWLWSHRRWRHRWKPEYGEVMQ
jgi:KDO2-lipid IV(A) lauroyltransferase